jgi:hypothetical protein
MLALKNFSSVSQLFAYFNEVYERGDEPPLHIFCILPKQGLTPEQLEEIALENELKCEFKKKGEKLYFFNIGIRKRAEAGYLLIDGSYWIFLTNQSNSRLRSIITSFVNKLFPFIKLSYVNSIEILDLIERVSKSFDKTYFLEGTICSKGETFRNWKKKPIEFSVDVLNDRAEKENAKWSSILISSYVKDEPKLKIRLHDRGQLTLYKGSFNDFYKEVVIKFISKGLNTDKLFTHKERKVINNKVRLNPIKAILDENLNFEDITILKNSLLRKYSSAIIHAGNPMLLIQLTDKKDGSSFDLYASKNLIEIVPLMKASSGALTNLFSLISDILPSLKLTK